MFDIWYGQNHIDIRASSPTVKHLKQYHNEPFPMPRSYPMLSSRTQYQNVPDNLANNRKGPFRDEMLRVSKE